MRPMRRNLLRLEVIRRLAPMVPIVVLTAGATAELVERVQLIGVYKVINKPFEMDELAPLIREALRAESLG